MSLLAMELVLSCVGDTTFIGEYMKMTIPDSS